MELIATLSELQNGNGKRFRFRRGDAQVDAFIIEFGGQVRAYINMCMHEPIELDNKTGKFFDASRRQIKCRNHGATFDALSGMCTDGPCPNTALKKVAVKVEGDNIYLDR